MDANDSDCPRRPVAACDAQPGATRSEVCHADFVKVVQSEYTSQGIGLLELDNKLLTWLHSRLGGTRTPERIATPVHRQDEGRLSPVIVQFRAQVTDVAIDQVAVG